ncbi:hypothetical protein GTPT_0564 [Tatumella ptyseos ATCC 33301]|uniref:Uncharacterized protein n=1 Tax=Tatumella ptyseos ATCC 33301 TaxID=1005995 RepID=A0A085JNE4_9GAMM|nr:hypothetical protein GTPT_0564 [Tatumella ptyseos ATCC 33301]
MVTPGEKISYLSFSGAPAVIYARTSRDYHVPSFFVSRGICCVGQPEQMTISMVDTP